MTTLRRSVLFALLLIATCLALPLRSEKPVAEVAFPFREGDRVAWIGSSSTRIGVWPQTMEFLLRTRHPGVRLTFQRFTTGGGTFATGLEKLDGWLGEFKPTLVFFNYGGNDAGQGEKGLPRFKENMERCVAKAKETGARVVFMTPQAADVRKSGEAPAARRRLYAETMISLGKEKGWAVVDTHHPLEAIQRDGQKDNEAYTILKDTIHLTDPAYIAWGYYLYERLSPPRVESVAVLTAAGEVTKAVGCKVRDVRADKDGLSFVRADEVLPLLPPVPLPPRKLVPLERLSPYLLTITDLPEGKYEIACEDKAVGTADAKELAAGVNLNLFDFNDKSPPPWVSLAKDVWAGRSLDQIGKTAWRFSVRKP